MKPFGGQHKAIIACIHLPVQAHVLVLNLLILSLMLFDGLPLHLLSMAVYQELCTTL